MFAAIVLAVAGIMRIFDAIWAFRYHGVLPGNLEAAIFGHSLKTYGWIYLAVAAVRILCAVLVLSGSQVGRWAGIVAGAIGCISAIWWMPFYPIWSLRPCGLTGKSRCRGCLFVRGRLDTRRTIRLLGEGQLRVASVTHDRSLKLTRPRLSPAPNRPQAERPPPGAGGRSA